MHVTSLLILEGASINQRGGGKQGMKYGGHFEKLLRPFLRLPLAFMSAKNVGLILGTATLKYAINLFVKVGFKEFP